MDADQDHNETEIPICDAKTRSPVQIPTGPKPSKKAMADVEALRQSLKGLNVWEIAFSDHLNGFREAIATISTAVTDSDKGRLSLADAAYVIYNAGAIWAKRVDEMCRMACRTTDVVASVDGRKGNKDTDEGDGKESRRQQRKRSAHPLSLCPDDRKGERFLGMKANRRIPADRCTSKEFPQLPQDSFLAEVQPRSLGLMEHEKIRPYVDDRGNKGNDWADFRINTLKLSTEGYFAMSCLHPDAYEPVEELQQENQQRRYTISDGELMDFDDAGPNGDDVPADNLELLGENDQHANFEDPRPAGFPPKIVLSEGRPDRPVNLPHMPFRKVTSISTLKASRSLLQMEATKEANQELQNFRMRTKRLLQKRKARHVSTEVEFFQYFWAIPENCENPTIRLAKVIRRFSQRLRRVETVVPGRGRKRKEVTFVSDGEAMECPFAVSDVPNLNFYTSAEKLGRDLGEPDYLETDEPIAAEDDLYDPPAHHGEDDFFGKMRAEGRFVRQSDRQNMEDFDVTITSSKIGNVDLCDWEAKLGDFLKTHELATLSFNLEDFGRGLLESMKPSGNDEQVLTRVMRRDTTGDVCRSFLSMLDLVNKNKITLNTDKEKEDDLMNGGLSFSQGADEIGIRVNVDAHNGRRKGLTAAGSES